MSKLLIFNMFKLLLSYFVRFLNYEEKNDNESFIKQIQSNKNYSNVYYNIYVIHTIQISKNQ